MQQERAFFYNMTGNLLWLIARDDFTQAAQAAYAATARCLCAEAGDGLLLFNTRTYELWIINQDGSPGTFCGNGLLAAALFCWEATAQEHCSFKMAGRSIEAQSKGEAVAVWLDPPGAVSLKQGAYFIAEPNPHLVWIEPDQHWQLAEEGRTQSLTYDTNVEWVFAAENGVKVDVYERGVGPTAACGSGALAVFQVLHHLGCVEDALQIQMPGGCLTVRREGSKLKLQGHGFLSETRMINAPRA
jgi:diaminopimelate epimerase